ncbi:hypothetical protein PI27_gp010 [Listeria phage WIL-1]|nr:hypothetical protein PI27_gp010 [Listeria phage WIL-1]
MLVVGLEPTSEAYKTTVLPIELYKLIFLLSQLSKSPLFTLVIIS